MLHVSTWVLLLLLLLLLQVEMKLKAETNILLRSNSRLKADKAADAAQVEALASQLSGLKQQLAEAAAVADKLRGELAERDGVIGDNYASLQGLRRRVQELETHKFVLGYKVSCACRYVLLSNSEHVFACN
jgi:chromosome segregation ATPase